MQFLRVSTLIMLLQASFHLAAAEISTSPLQGYQSSTWNQLNSENGFITSLPSTSSGRLIQEMSSLQSDLRHHKAQLAENVDTSKFTFGDGLITAVMPGGLLYAAVKQKRHKEALAQLDRLDRQLDELNQELTQYKATVYGTGTLSLGPQDQPGLQLN